MSGFAGRGFKIDGEFFAGGVLLTPLAATPWNAPPLTLLTIGILEPLLDLDPRPDTILIGTGPAFARPPGPFIHAVNEWGIGVDWMDSRAAARAWAVLRAEDRWIAAALMPL